MKMKMKQVPSSDNTEDQKVRLSRVVVPLLKGVIDVDERPEVWSELLDLQATVRDYVAVLGLRLILDESEGYAFLASENADEEEGERPATPRLIARRQLSYPVSLLLALLRKKLAEFDAGGGETRLILSRDEIVEMVRIFLPSGSNEVRLIDQVESNLKRVIEFGFVRQLRGESRMYEVRRIIKAFIDAQWLAEFDQRLSEYRRHAAESGASREGDDG